MKWVAVLFSFLVVVHTTYAAGGALEFAPSQISARVQETFEVVVIADTVGESVAAAEGDIVYDPAQLDVVAVSTSGSVLSLWATEPSVVSPGRVQFSGWAATPLSGSSERLISIVFRPRTSGAQTVRLESGALLTQGNASTNIVSTLGTLAVQTTVPESASTGDGQVLGVQTSTLEAPKAPTLSDLDTFVEGDRLVIRGVGESHGRIVLSQLGPSGERTERVVADADGVFVFVSSWRLEPGIHTIRAESYSDTGLVSPRTETHIVVQGRSNTALLAAVFLGAPSYVTLLVGVLSFIIGFLLYHLLSRSIFHKL